jgi:anti-sigma B factor antagonist
MEQLNPETPGLVIEQAVDVDGDPLVTLRGELDMTCADAFREVVEKVLVQRPTRLVFEVTDLRFIDSSGIAVLILASNNVDEVELHHSQPIVRRVVELTGLSGTLRMIPS